MIPSRGATVAPGTRREDGFRERGGATTRLEAFVDAAFAFAVTLLIVSFDRIPDSTAALVVALKGVPAFAASFLLIASFWRGHVDWSGRYGLDHREVQRLSLLLVFVALVFVFPLRMMFATLFAFVSDGWFPADLRFATLADVRIFFFAFAIGLGSMGMTMLLLYRSAWQRREALALDAAEIAMTRIELMRWAGVPAIAAVSVLMCASETLVTIGAPGFVFFALNIGQWWLDRRRERVKRAAFSAVADG